MTSTEQLEARMRASARGIRFAEIERVCRERFGEPRRSTGSHVVFKLPWAGDPRVNIQNVDGMAKPYQVKQVLAAIDKLIELEAEEESEVSE